MLVSVGDVRLFVNVDGAKFVAGGDSMRGRPTIVMPAAIKQLSGSRDAIAVTGLRVQCVKQDLGKRRG